MAGLGMVATGGFFGNMKIAVHLFFNKQKANKFFRQGRKERKPLWKQRRIVVVS